MKKNSELKIEKGVPIPARARRGRFIAMKEMQVGDSVFFEDATTATNAAQHYLGPGNYKSQAEGSGRRVWRTA